MTSKRIRNLTPVERAMLVAEWRQRAVTSRIHVLIGGDGLKLVNGAGRIFWVVLDAAVEHQLDPEGVDLRILRGACNALAEQAENSAVDETRRASVIAGLEACDRLLPELSQRALGDAALKLHALLAVGDVRFAHFEALMAGMRPERKAA